MINDSQQERGQRGGRSGHAHLARRAVAETLSTQMVPNMRLSSPLAAALPQHSAAVEWPSTASSSQLMSPFLSPSSLNSSCAEIEMDGSEISGDSGEGLAVVVSAERDRQRATQAVTGANVHNVCVTDVNAAGDVAGAASSGAERVMQLTGAADVCMDVGMLFHAMTALNGCVSPSIVSGADCVMVDNIAEGVLSVESDARAVESSHASGCGVHCTC
jgi:hypothetical protein